MRSLALAAATTAVLLAAGCASGDTSDSASTTPSAPVTSPAPSTPSGTGSPSATAGTTASAAAVKEIRVTISGGKISPAPGRVRVDKGQSVKITVTGDQADEIHVHGYDKEAAFAPGRPAVVQFTADQTGQFEVETHETEKVLFFLLVK
jgi:hypothetical protein